MGKSVYAVVTITAYERKIARETKEEYLSRIHDKYQGLTGLGDSAISVMVIGWYPSWPKKRVLRRKKNG